MRFLDCKFHSLLRVRLSAGQVCVMLPATFVFSMRSYEVIGLMSGTSLDGVDLAYCRFEHDRSWSFEIVSAKTYAYPQKWQDILKNVQELKSEHLLDIDRELGFYYAHLIENFINEHQVSPDFIASHGHTALHRPELQKTLQLGSGEVMCQELGLSVVNDFRKNDVLLGGQGAPLVPMGDELLFGQYAACLNLGGFGNISFSIEGQRRAFDICPVNMALNEVAEITGRAYDAEGKMARSGTIHQRLLDTLNALEYYSHPGPKSLGREWYLSDFRKKYANRRIPPIDLLATLIEHVAIQIALTTEHHAISEMLITGGGAFNHFLIERISHHSNSDLIIPDNLLIEFKEALVFAFLGTLRMRNDINVLASVTGSQKDHCSGIIHRP